MKVARVGTVVLAGLCAAAGGVFLAPAADAGETTVQCTVPDLAGQVPGGGPPSCATIDGLCLILPTAGVARAVHPAGAIVEPPGDCSAFPEECVIEISPPPGPSRAAHATSATPAGFPGSVINVPPQCLELPETGADVQPLIIAALAALGAGAALLALRRRSSASA